MTRLRLTPRRRTLVWLWFVMVVCGGAFAFVYWFSVQTVTGRQLADAAIRGASLTRSQAATAVNPTLDAVTTTALIAAMAAIAMVALIRLRRVNGLVAVGLLIAANVSSRVLKVHVLPRPDLGLAEFTPATLNSLPSGHTTAAFSIGVAALFVVPAVLRGVTAAAGIVFSSAVAIATLSAGWHRVGDSLASFFLVAIWACLGGVVILVADPAFAPREPRRAGRWWTATVVALTAIAGILMAGALTDREVPDWAVSAPAAFVAGGVLIVGTAAVMTFTVLNVVSRVTDAGPTTGPQ